MNLLLSIKPEFVDKILTHKKLYEFRKSIFKQNVDKIFIYSSYPVKKIVGYFEVTEIICEIQSRYGIHFQKIQEFLKKTFLNIMKVKIKVLQ